MHSGQWVGAFRLGEKATQFTQIASALLGHFRCHRHGSCFEGYIEERRTWSLQTQQYSAQHGQAQQYSRDRIWPPRREVPKKFRARIFITIALHGLQNKQLHLERHPVVACDVSRVPS